MLCEEGASGPSRNATLVGSLRQKAIRSLAPVTPADANSSRRDCEEPEHLLTGSAGTLPSALAISLMDLGGIASPARAALIVGLTPDSRARSVANQPRRAISSLSLLGVQPRISQLDLVPALHVTVSSSAAPTECQLVGGTP